MSDDFGKYEGMTVERLNAMKPIERADYYHAMYQHAGQMLGILVQVDGNTGVDDYVEHFAYGAVGSAHEALLDALAALVEIADRQRT